MANDHDADETYRIVRDPSDAPGPAFDGRPTFVAPRIPPPTVSTPAPVAPVPRASQMSKRVLLWVTAAVVVLALGVALLYFKPWAGPAPSQWPTGSSGGEWSAVLGGTGDDALLDVAVTGDGVVAVGYTASSDGDFPIGSPANGEDALIVKMTADGNLAWAKTFGGGGDDRFESVAVGPDGRIYAAGVFKGADGDQAVVYCLTASGNVAWSKTYDGVHFAGVAMAADGGVIVVGSSEATTGTFADAKGGLVAELSTRGDVRWAHSFGDPGTSFGAVAVAGDGTIFAPGLVSGDAGADTAAMVAVKPDGTQLWLNGYADGGLSHINGLAVQDGRVIVVGAYLDPATYSYALVAAIDATDGTLAWVTPVQQDPSGLRAVCVTAGGDIIAAGSDLTSQDTADAASSDGVIVDVATDGTVAWNRLYGGSADDYFVGVAMAPNGQIIVVGATQSTDGVFPMKHPGTGGDAVVGVLNPDGT